MMAARTEFAEGRPWRFEPDAEPAAADRFRSIARARVIDETSGAPISQALRVSSRRTDLSPRVSRDGLAGLVGRPALAFPALASVAQAIDMRIECPGFLPRQLAGTLGPIAGFPDAYAPLDFGDVALHRIGVAIEGRAMRRMPVNALPLAGAAVRLEAIWSTLPTAWWTPPALAEPPRVVACDPGFRAPRAVGTSLRQRTLTPGITSQMLLLPAAPGASRVRLLGRQGLGVGDDLMIDSGDATRSEVIRIAAIEPTPADDLACWVTLAHACRRLHLDGIVCSRVAMSAPTVSDTLQRDALEGDRVAFTAASTTWTDGAWVEIDDGVSVPEWQRVTGYATTTDAGGYFRMPPIARVALVQLRVHSVPLADARPIVTLDYRVAIQDLTVSLE